MRVLDEALNTLGGLLLPVAIALLCEEILFGGLVQLLLAPRLKASKRNERSTKGEISCSR